MKLGCAHIFLSCWALFATGTIWAAGTQQASAAHSSDPVQVSIETNNWTVQILKPSHLRAVLESVCEQSQTVCDISPDLNNEMVAPMVVRGAASKVMSELLEGVKVNYSYAPPDSQGKGRLIVENPPPGALDASSGASQQPPQSDVQPVAQPDVQTAADMNPSPAEPVTSSPTADAADSGMAENSGMSQGSLALPFLGSNGQLHAAAMSNESSAFLPVLNSTGNLVPYTGPSNGASSTVSPILGPDGKLITVPLGHSSWDSIPALDRNGNLLPAPRQ